MKKMPHAGLLALFTALCLPVFSTNVPQKVAEKVAKNIYYERAIPVGTLRQSEISVTSVSKVFSDDQIAYYIFNINRDGGFVIVSGIYEAVPVLGYSFEGSFRDDNLPGNIRSWLDSYRSQIESIDKAGLPADETTSAMWEYYSSSAFNPGSTLSGIPPLVNARWDQGCYFNQSCPVTSSGGDCGRVWVGCVATAMGMIMKYHAYPAQGNGNHTYTHATYGTQSANFGATTYSWAAMPNIVNTHNSALATTLYHLGVSVDMNYGPNGSGAYIQDSRSSLVNYFGYSNAAQYVKKFYYTSSGWEQLMRENCNAHRPVLFAGQDPTFGHAFVLDGYQGTNYFHFNWGWSGWNNGYFYLSNLNSGNGNFTDGQEAVVSIYPSNQPNALFNTGSSTICTGSTVSFMDISTGGATSWNWQFPGGVPVTSNAQHPTVTYNSQGAFDVTLTITSATGTHSLTKPAYVNVYANPSVNLPADTIICCNNTITLSAGNPGSVYLWSTGATTQSVVIDSSGTGIGTKVVWVKVGPPACIDTDTITVSFAPCTGIETPEQPAIQIYPNPTQGMVSIETGDDNPWIKNVRVLDINGKMVATHSFRGNNTSLDLHMLQHGMYFLELQQDQMVTRKKIAILK